MAGSAWGSQRGDGPVTVELTRDRTINAERVIFPKRTAGITAIQPGGDAAESEHVDRLVAISAPGARLIVELRSDEVLEADYIRSRGHKHVVAKLASGGTRQLNTTKHIKTVTAEVAR